MQHTFYKHYYHLVFATQDRRCALYPALRSELWRYFQEVARQNSTTIFQAGGVRDHVHLLVDIPPSKAVSEIVGKLKANSSRWLRSKIELFKWQRGYASFTVSESLRGKVEKYIAGQEQRHESQSFPLELEMLLEKHGVL